MTGMHVQLASEPGRPGRQNEDFVGAVAGAVALVDAASVPDGDAVCLHGPAWYARRLGSHALARLAAADGSDLRSVLADAIEEVTASHRGTCDVAHPTSPQGTVAIARAYEGRLDHLVLADCHVLLSRASGEVEMITDPREVDAQRECSAPLVGLTPGTPEHEDTYAGCVRAIRARRNAPGGYWLAKDDPYAAAEAVVGSTPLRDLAAVSLLSNGARRLVDPHGRLDWPGVAALLHADGPAALLRRTRAAEALRGDRADDASVITWRSPDDR